LHNRELQTNVKRTPFWKTGRKWPRWGPVNTVWKKGPVDESYTPVAKGHRAIEGYPILLGSIHETPQGNGSGRARGAQIASGIPPTKESGSTRFLGRDIKPKNRRVRSPEIAQD
jgi:hypothetical protein